MKRVLMAAQCFFALYGNQLLFCGEFALKVANVAEHIMYILQ